MQGMSFNLLMSDFSNFERNKLTGIDYMCDRGIDTNGKRNMEYIFSKMSKPTLSNTGFNHVKNTESIRLAFRPILIVAQCFGIFPVHGVWSTKASDLRYTWKSFKFLYSCLIIISVIFHLIYNIRWLIIDSINVNRMNSKLHVVCFTSSTMFYSTTALLIFMIIKFSSHWPNLMVLWENMEERSLSKSTWTLPNHINLTSKFKILYLGIMTLALVENILFIINGCFDAYINIEKNEEIGAANIFSRFFLESYPHVLTTENYTLWKGIISLITNNFYAFAWNFMDLFLILISTALINEYKKLNYMLHCHKNKAMSQQWWCKARESYNDLCEMTHKIDSKVSSIVLLSFVSNLYFICIHLLNSFTPKSTWIHKIYFCYAFGFVILRILLFSLSAAKINEESRLPALVLYKVSSRSYSQEVERFLTRVTTDNVCLTGMKFFSITRGLILTIASTIITYEVILFQFHGLHNDK